ncbi:hypothetical protein GW17_00059007 [Ensete ventricosum]|nr:hypothetical protein GW17_00059007 [Ensete ventricosum]
MKSCLEADDPCSSTGIRRSRQLPRAIPSQILYCPTPQTHSGLNYARFFWLLIERPPVTVPEMLQRTNQYTTAEVLVVGKRMDHKRPRSEKP